MIYNFMLFPQMKQSQFNNDQDKQEVIKHCRSKVYKTENMLSSPKKYKTTIHDFISFVTSAVKLPLDFYLFDLA